MSLNQMMHVVMEETPYLPEPGVTVTMDQLIEEERAEVVAFLAERPNPYGRNGGSDPR